MSGRDVGSEMANMAANLEEKSGRSMSWWIGTVLSSDNTKHGEMVAYLKEHHGLTHGYANLVAHAAREQTAGGPVSKPDLVTAQYKGKDGLHAIYKALIRSCPNSGTMSYWPLRRPGSASVAPNNSL